MLESDSEANLIIRVGYQSNGDFIALTDSVVLWIKPHLNSCKLGINIAIIIHVRSYTFIPTHLSKHMHIHFIHLNIHCLLSLLHAMRSACVGGWMVVGTSD